MSEPPRDDPADVIALGAGRYLLVAGSDRRLAFAARSGNATWVFINGRVHVIEPAPAGRRTARADDRAELTAPMPATVARINVTEGQRVGRGDILLILEAMKMELPLKAARDGTVTRILCQAGALVQPGVPLLEIE